MIYRNKSQNGEKTLLIKKESLFLKFIKGKT